MKHSATNPLRLRRSRRTGASHAAGPALYLVATPIGNLEDITLRAVRVLKEVDVIACEDTRQTQKLLNHYGITTRTISYHEHNEMTRAAELVKEMQEGASVALVTDAGMPGISDPGFRLISLAIRHHVPVVPIPGHRRFWRRWWPAVCRRIRSASADFFPQSAASGGRRWKRSRLRRARRFSTRLRTGSSRRFRMLSKFWERPACGDCSRSDQAA